MTRQLKILISAGAMILLISAFFATMTFAADEPGSSTGTTQTLAQEFMNKLATKLGITQDKLQTAVKDSQNEIIDEQLQKGNITQDQATRLKERVSEDNGVLPFGGMHGGRGGMMGWGHGFGMGTIDVSSFLGITTQDLRTELQSGKTLAQVAEAHGKTADQLKTYIHDQYKSKLDQAVTDGRLTQAQADQVLSNLDSRLDSIINGESGQFGGRGMGFCPGWGQNGNSTTTSGGGSL